MASDTEYSTRFSGHETFPLRYGWLYKAVNEVHHNRRIRSTKEEDVRSAVIHMGVGKNMVSAIKYWSDISNIVVDKDGVDSLTAEAELIFGATSLAEKPTKRLDPYMEHPATTWLVHWFINANFREVSAARWFFNFFNGQRFDKKTISIGLKGFLEKEQITTFSEKTVDKDIDCFLLTYSQRSNDGKTINEDSFSSPLTELGLIKAAGGKSFRSELDNKPELPTAIFVYALIRYWQAERPGATTISFDNFLTSPGSPARVFRLSQSGLADLIDRSSELTGEKISWTDTQGLRGITCSDITSLDALDYVQLAYTEKKQ